ncbi:hypothetical protein RBG61_06510 [Paludicola sp. MB14-C6]|uniref:hypothetical protein n=1 Tax=Paludihabitans sp. MB14-C6 TaxID=3070656 RepID=UPI0027DBB617|nr:hypothetical protein [Paludicola sp. MB14-C6]WMJ24313.1 hypothetical protein RBG61_06510 [Paludicola sp. MB14-C6]
MKRFIINLAYSFTSLLIVGALLLNNVPVVTASTPNSDSLLACGWVTEFDDINHWERCINHSDTGEYNGVQHTDGKRNITQHRMTVDIAATCKSEGKCHCIDCGYTKILPKHEHTLTGTWLPTWYYHKDRQYCTTCKENVALRNCTYAWYTLPATYQSGVGRCTACGREVTIPPLSTTCPSGGQHDFHNQQFVPYDTENCGLTCTKCHKIIKIQEHNHSEGCRFCGGWNTNGTVKILAKENGDGKTPRIKVGIWTSPAYGCVNGSTSETQFYGYNKNGELPYLLPNQNVTFYNGYGEIWIQAQDVDVWGKLFVYSSPQGKYGRSGFYANTGEQFIDDTPPSFVSYKVTQKNSANSWSNIGTATVTVKDMQSGDCQMSVYDGARCLKDWTPMTKTGDTYTGSLDFYGDFTTSRDILVKVKDKNNNRNGVPLRVTNIENVAPSLNLSVKDIGVETATIVADANDGTGSGVNRIRLPDGTFIRGNHAEYKISKNNTYTFRVEDNIGNARTKVITVNDVIDYISADVTYTPFVISSEKVQPGLLTLLNTSDVPIKLTLKSVVVHTTGIKLVDPYYFTDEQWLSLGMFESSQYFSIGLQDNQNTQWLYSRNAFNIYLKPKEMKKYNVITKSGRSFKEQKTIDMEFHFDITKG